MWPFYVQALLYGAAPEVLVDVVVAAAAVTLVEVIPAADAPGNEETERQGSF